MGSPFRKDQLSPEMAERYGLDGRPWGTRLLAGALILGFAIALVIVTVGIVRSTGGSGLLTWEVRSPDHVTVTYSIRRAEGEPLECAIRAQDGSHVDVGYAIVAIAPGPASMQQVVELRTIAEPVNVEVLGCDAPGRLNVIDPQFPPGVVPPTQPWTQ